MASFLGDREHLQPKSRKRAAAYHHNKPTRELDPEEEEIHSSSAEDSDDAALPSKKKTKKDTIKAEETENHTVKDENDSVKIENDVWNPEEVQELLGRIEKLVPENDSIKYSTRAEKMDWDVLAFGDHTGEACLKKWNDITRKVRRWRTMSEMITDAKVLAAKPWSLTGKKAQRHPDMPKKPLTPYLRYFMDKRAKYVEDHPGVSATETTKELAKKFKTLSEKRKKKYLDSYQNECDGYKVAYEHFKLNHPELCATSKKRGKVIEGPAKPLAALQIFVSHKCDEHLKKKPNDNPKQVSDRYRKKWSELPDLKKMKWIKKAMEEKLRYERELEEYKVSHPDFQSNIKSKLTKVEQKLKDQLDGKPNKPPPNGYGLFSQLILAELRDIPNTERMAEVSRRWKSLSDGERDNYNKLCDQKQTKFREDYEKWKMTLTDEERKKVESEEKVGTKKKPKSEQEAHRKPLNALFLYIEEKRDRYSRKHPDLNPSEVSLQLGKQFSELSEKKKDKYRRLEEDCRMDQQLMEKYMKQGERNGHSPSSPKPQKSKKITFPGEPKRPPGSGYQLYSMVMLSKLSDIPGRERLAHVSMKWRELSTEEKNEYNKKRLKLQQQYDKDLEKFKKKLSPTDMKKWEEVHKQPTKSKSKAVKATKMEESSEGSSSDSDDSKESSSSSDSSSSDSDSSSDDDSEKENETPATNKVVQGSANSSSGDDNSASDDSDAEEEMECNTKKPTKSVSESDSSSSSGSSSDSDDSD